MPKMVTHILILEKAMEKLSMSDDPYDREILRILRENKKEAIMGAIGPDLFFWGMDYETSRILKDMLEIYKFFKGLYDNTIGRVMEAFEAVGEVVEDAVGLVAPGALELIKTVLEELGETANIIGEIGQGAFLAPVIARVNAIASAEVLSLDEFALYQVQSLGGLLDLVRIGRLGHYLFDLMNTPLQLGENEDKWYWFDMLHYRRTTLFAYNLLKNATDDKSRAFAYGYLTHIAGDVVGHPYVNSIVLGPYRLHPQRHAVVENFIDAWVFREYYGGDISQSLGDVVTFPDEIAPSIIGQLYNSFIETYSDVPHPQLINPDLNGFYTMEQIEETIILFRDVVDLLTNTKPLKPEPPFEGVWEAIETAIERFREPPSPPDGDLCFSWDCIERGLEYIADMVLWTVETILAVIDTVLTVLASIPVTQLLAILYAIQYGLYEILSVFRDILVYAGYQYPNNEELETEEAKKLISPSDELEAYPYLHDHDETALENPSNGFEYDLRVYGPYRPGDTPRTFIEELEFYPGAVYDFATARTPDETLKLLEPIDTSRGISYGSHMGNAVDFSIWLFRNIDEPTGRVRNANWNLDGDRAYGYRQWRANNLPVSDDERVIESYIEA